MPYPPYQQPILDRGGRVSRPWQLFFLQLAQGGGTSGGGGGAPAGNPGDVQYNDDGELAGRPIWEFGYWAPITNGDPVSPEVLFDSNGDAVVGWQPTV